MLRRMAHRGLMRVTAGAAFLPGWGLFSGSSCAVRYACVLFCIGCVRA